MWVEIEMQILMSKTWNGNSVFGILRRSKTEGEPRGRSNSGGKRQRRNKVGGKRRQRAGIWWGWGAGGIRAVRKENRPAESTVVKRK